MFLKKLWVGSVYVALVVGITLTLMLVLMLSFGWPSSHGMMSTAIANTMGWTGMSGMAIMCVSTLIIFGDPR